MEKKKCIKVYVSGPITGLSQDRAYINFYEAGIKINKFFQKEGFEQVAVFNPMQKPGTFDGVSYQDCMEIDFMYINKCDAIYMMKGWEGSVGASMERKYALFMNKLIFTYSKLNEIDINTWGLYEEFKHCQLT